MDEAHNQQTTRVEHHVGTNSLLLKVILTINFAGILLTFFLIGNLTSTINKNSGALVLASVYDTNDRFKEIRRKNLVDVDELDSLRTQVDLNISQSEILEKSDLLYKNEKDTQLFLRLLKVNMHFLASQIPGAQPWFEIYVEEVNWAIERSRSRQKELLVVKRFYEKQGLIQI